MLTISLCVRVTPKPGSANCVNGPFVSVNTEIASAKPSGNPMIMFAFVKKVTPELQLVQKFN